MEANSLRELDEPSAALRLLFELSRAPQRFSVGELYGVMSALGVGRTAVDSSRRALIGARDFHNITAFDRMVGVCNIVR